MFICSNCGLEMTCVKTGRDVVFMNPKRVYSGDEYECPFCEHRIINCDSQPRYDNPPDGCLRIDSVSTKEKTLEEGDCGVKIGIFLLRQRQGVPSKELIREVLNRDYPGCSIEQSCVESKPGIWLIGTYEEVEE